jgi:hypothetical protein
MRQKTQSCFMRLITSSLIDGMTSSSEEDILMNWCCSFSTNVWILMHRKGTLAARVCIMKLTSASWLRPVCGGFHNLIRFNCALFFASWRRHRVLTVTCLDACRCAAYLRWFTDRSSPMMHFINSSRVKRSGRGYDIQFIYICDTYEIRL